MRHEPGHEGTIAFRAEIALGILLVDEALFRALDGLEDRRGAIAGAVDADPEVDLVRTRIGGVELDEREQRIGGLGFESVEHGRVLARA